MKRLTQGALVCVLMLALASVAAAQGTLQVPSGAAQPAVRFGNFIEVGNDPAALRPKPKPKVDRQAVKAAVGRAFSRAGLGA